jgi:hypothetical protein
MSASPPVQSRLLAVPKAGVGADEYEDAAGVRAEEWPVRAAVADGATESIFAQAWAETLVKGLCRTSATPEALATALPDWRATWASALDDQTDEMPWYAAAKAQEGAFATLLGLELRSDGRWRAVGVGDSVLFQLRDAALRRSWPYTDPGDFSNRPVLLSSRAHPECPVPGAVQTVAGRWQRGDTFLLATDAVAAWLLRAEPPQEHRLGPRTDPTAAWTWDADAFRDAVAAARADDRLRNDDSTLLVLDVRGLAETGDE